MRSLPVFVAVLAVPVGVAGQTMTPEEVSELPYDHPVIVDVVAGPPEADSIEAYTRIVWLDPITHERRIEKEAEVRTSKALLLNVVVASPHRPATCTLTVSFDDRRVLERTVRLRANGIVQESLELDVTSGHHTLSIQVADESTEDTVSCHLRVDSSEGDGGENNRFPVQGLVPWPRRRKRRW
ncbi:hypothetical protein [Methanopyrus sp.]